MWQILHGCLRVSRILVNKASGDSVLQVLGNKARKKCQIVPALPMYNPPFTDKAVLDPNKHLKSEPFRIHLCVVTECGKLTHKVVQFCKENVLKGLKPVWQHNHWQAQG